MKYFILNILFFLFFCFQVNAQQPEGMIEQASNSSVTEPNVSNTSDINTPMIEGQGEAKPEGEKTETPEKKYKLFNGKDIETLNSGFKSILFHKEYIDLLHDSLLDKPVEFHDIKNLLSNSDMKKPESRPAPEVLQNIRVESPSIYLKTIMLAENGKWTIWYNGTKIREEEVEKDSKIKIIEVNDRNVLFQLQVEHIDQLSPKYLEKLQPIEEGSKLLRKPNSAWNYISKDGNILFDTVQGIVRFRIGVNQTFSLYDADIYEGFKESTMVSVKVKQKLDSFSNTIPSEPVQ